MRRWLSALIFVTAAACGGGGGGDDTTGYDRIDVKPGQTTVTVGLGQTQTVDYMVYGIKGSEAARPSSRSSSPAR